MASASRLAHLPVGSGYRSSFNGLVVTVFGASGLVGRLVTNRLGRDGASIVAATHRDNQFSKDLKVCGDLGQVNIQGFNLRDEESIYNCVKHSDVVINCVNRPYFKKFQRNTFRDTNAIGAGRLARISKEAGVERFIHNSAVGCHKDHASQFMRSKAEGEELVREGFPEATIIRTCLPIDRYDRSLHFIRSQWAMVAGIKPVFAGSYKTAVKYPVCYRDIAKATLAASTDSDAIGRTYELYGPSKYTVEELYELCFLSLFRNHYLVPVPAAVCRAFVWFHEMHLFDPLFSRDELNNLYSAEKELSGMPGLAELGITPEDTKFVIIDAMRMWRSPYFDNISYDDVVHEQEQIEKMRQ